MLVPVQWLKKIETEAKDLPHLLNERRIEFKLVTGPHPTQHGNYSLNRIFPSFLALAVTQRLASSVTILRRIGGGALLCLKILAFHSFHIVEDTSMVREAIALLLGFVMSVLLSHQSKSDS